MVATDYKIKNLFSGNVLKEGKWIGTFAGVESLEFTVPSTHWSYLPSGDPDGGLLYPLAIELNEQLVAHSYIHLDPN